MPMLTTIRPWCRFLLTRLPVWLLSLCVTGSRAQPGARPSLSLNDQWQTLLRDSMPPGALDPGPVTGWLRVNLPHNWDDYEGDRNLLHGNLHGTAWYRKSFTAPNGGPGKRYFLRFEGVGTYATIWVNGHSFGRHPIGRTVFTLDVTEALQPGRANDLLVKAEHPALIADMPWVCGGCSSEWGFSEGSQPLGIFRPVALYSTGSSRIEPFGVHIWNDAQAKTIQMETEIHNYGTTTASLVLESRFCQADGRELFRLQQPVILAAGTTTFLKQSAPIGKAIRWSLQHPYLYTLTSTLHQAGDTADRVQTRFGIRTISWPVLRRDNDHRFLLNGQPVFINGTCEYEHEFGQSHAFSDAQVQARVKEVIAAGFNAFRDAHQPHNLRYLQAWDSAGVLCWPQFSAHIWYDDPAFRDNFKAFLRQWVKERRNSPSVVLWGLQNESVLPKAFAEECTAIIRELDPTAIDQRAITTCNGGEGTDWNVVQNWSGTYGGDPFQYGQELAGARQLLNGEYGAWRSLDLHTEGEFDAKGPWSEDRMTQLLELKIRLAEAARDSVCGQFQWVFASHDNPGRRQPDEGYRLTEKVGPFNYKGLLTPWEEPLDAYYLYRANYVPASRDPMVYVVSHTWPDRFLQPRKATLRVFSNCEEVELFNDAGEHRSLGRRRKGPVGSHFQWDHVLVQYNVLYAVGYQHGKAVARDVVVLNHLPTAPHFKKLYGHVQPLLKAAKDYHYLYRVNCGGDAYTDTYGQTWSQDVALGQHPHNWGSVSWTDDYPGLNPYLASQRPSTDPIAGTRNWPLFQTIRFGRHKLGYHFPVPDGRYRVELYFVEPWWGTGGSIDCRGLRRFNVAVNGQVVLPNLDIWAEAGHDRALKKTVYVTVTNNRINISFPAVQAGQAVIAGIAIATEKPGILPAAPAPAHGWSWSNIPCVAVTPADALPQDQNSRQAVRYEAEAATRSGDWQQQSIHQQTGVVFNGGSGSIEWTIHTGLAQVYALRFHYCHTGPEPVAVRLELIAADGTVVKSDELHLGPTGGKWRLLSTTTGGFINAGDYRVRLSAPDMRSVGFDALEVQ